MKRWLTPLAPYLPGAIVLICAVYLIAQMRPPRHDGPIDLSLLGHVPVSSEGRVKPMDTVARNSLLAISGRKTVKHEGQTLPAIRWLADVIARPAVAQQYEVFLIDNPDVLTLVGVEDKQRGLVSLAQIMPHAQKLSEQAQSASRQRPERRSVYQRHVLELWRDVSLYLALSRLEKPYVVPPLSDDQQWRPAPAALMDAHAGGAADPALTRLWPMFDAWHEQDAGRFNAAAAEYLTFLQFQMPDQMSRARYEMFFNQFNPYMQGRVLYLFAFFLAGASLLLASRPTASRTLWQSAVLVILLTFLVHTAGLVLRMYLQNRWGVFVTNLYSSAVFIGWACVILGLVLELYFRNGVGSLAASIIGFITLIIAGGLVDGDTMGVMQAVLDTNFWLATHVTTIAIGYSAVFIAGFIGIALILAGVFTRALDKSALRTLGNMIYGVVAFALLFSFVGTVLGGIWADQSWGRFWGWDPKENGAVLIVLMMALILHARWGGMIRERGMAVLSVAGNIVVAWSWFGTNMLGVGLHAYGGTTALDWREFIGSSLFWLLLFVFSQITIIGIGLMPMRLWQSFAPPAVDPTRSVPAGDPLAA